MDATLFFIGNLALFLCCCIFTNITHEIEPTHLPIVAILYSIFMTFIELLGILVANLMIYIINIIGEL